MARALGAGSAARRIVYLSLDLLEDQPADALVETVDRAYELAGSVDQPRLLLLDEVTSARRWRTSVKTMWDDGRIDGDIVVCTGSSAVDLAEDAVELLPGRRGPGRDFLVLPQDFGSFARALMPLEHRLQILLDDERHRRITEVPRRRGVFVAAVVREAIDRGIADPAGRRRAAAARLLDAPDMPLPEPPGLREELDALRARRA